MAIRSGFFNSVNGDRRYLANNFAEYFSTFIGNGVFPDPAIGLQVQAKLNMTITVKPGKGWINGYYLINDGDFDLTISNADGVLNRIDRVVMRWDINTRNIVVQLKKGSFASSPVAPALQRDQEIFELALADIYVAKGITSISQSAITDKRLEKSLCGIVSGVVDQIDTTNLFTQYNMSFNEWFDTVKDYLNDTAVGNVANKLAEHTLDESAHNLGTAPLKTNSKTIKEAINEVFISGNNVKKNVVDTLLSLDNTLPINTNSPWDKITESLPNVSGKSPMNVYIQPTEPVKKDGIWFKTAESNKPDVEDYKYDANVNSMDIRITTLAPALYFAGSIEFYKSKIYHIYPNSGTIYINCYDISNNTWSNLKTVSGGYRETSCIIGGKIYFLRGDKGYITEYNVDTNSLKDVFINSNWHPNVIATDGTNIFGSGLATGGNGNLFVSYNLLTGSYKTLPDSKVDIRVMNFSGGKIFCNTVHYGRIEIFNTVTNVWENSLEGSGNYSRNTSQPISEYEVFTAGGSWNGSYSSSMFHNTITKLNTSTGNVFYDWPILCKDEGNYIYCIYKGNSGIEFVRLTYNNYLIKGVNIDNSVSTSTSNYKAALNSMKPYKSTSKLENNFSFAHISKDGKTKLRNIPTYYGNGTNWTLANSIK